MYILGVNCSHHASIALLKDNEVVLFLHDERANRVKWSEGVPFYALNYIKYYTNKIDYVVFQGGIGIDFKDQYRKAMASLNSQGVNTPNCRVLNCKHHLAHAASAFYMSRFDEAHVIVMDGAGSIEHLGQINGEIIKASETRSDYHAVFPNIECVSKIFTAGYYNKQRVIPSNNAGLDLCRKYNTKSVTLSNQEQIGWKYAKVTSRLGFGNFNEGKTMGLSAYGSDDSADEKAKAAYSVQKELEQVFIDAVKKPLSTNIVLGGGCALNILGNSIIKKTYPHLNIFVDPIASDGTLSLGIAAHHFYSVTQCKDKLEFNAYKGPDHDINKDYIKVICHAYGSARKYSV